VGVLWRKAVIIRMMSRYEDRASVLQEIAGSELE
jgi:hypothetical protein